MSDADAVRVSIGATGYATDVTAGGHSVRADEPTSVGGGDTGPTPYGYLLAALGSCTAMTVRMYADRKGWPVRGVEVTLRYDRVHAEDCQECETKEGRIDRIDRTVSLDAPDLSYEQRMRLMEIADRCPVHRTLTSETWIRSARGESEDETDGTGSV